MALSLFSQRITTPKSHPSSLILAPKSLTKNHNFNIIKAESGNGNLDHLQRASIKTPQQKQPIKKRVVQSPPIGNFHFPFLSFWFSFTIFLFILNL
ncbi:hypothetical protein Hanom_Chr08g00684401 [Helianthus anomalus]